MSKPKFYDFSGWATKNDLRCSDGRTIRRDAFKDDDGRKVPLVWMHQHNDPENVLGHAILENRKDGVYAYCSFNDTNPGKQAKAIVQHGDVCSLSIWANQLKQNGGDVLHGTIKEVSVVLAGANPGAIIDFPVLTHGEESETEAMIRVDEPIEFFHSDEDDEDGEATVGEILDSFTDEERAAAEYLVGSVLSDDEDDDDDAVSHSDDDGRTVQDVIDNMSDEKRAALEYIIGVAAESVSEDEEDEDEDEDNEDDEDHEDKDSEDGETEHSDDEGEDFEMKHNVFENEEKNGKAVLTHADGVDMINFARDNHVSLKQVMQGWAEDNGVNPDELFHVDNGINNVEQVFPEYKLLNGPAPELMTTDQGWITKVINKVHKSPMSRLRVRFADVRDIEGRRAKGYKKGTQKDLAGNIDLLGRTVDPTTVYISSKLDRDDIVDITDFDYVNYMYQLDKMNLNEEIARQIMIGDGRTGEAQKAIDPTKIKPIWTDDDLFCIHTKVDIQGMRQTMNGSDSSKHFGDNYVYAEAILQSLLYARERYKGSGNPDFFCTPHLVNVMLLARDLNGRRIYDNISELTAALNVNSIITAEQFEGKTRTATVGQTTEQRELLGIMVNLGDYNVGATRGGQITHFTDFDIRFNQEISLIETRFSGMLVRPYSAIALEIEANPQ